MKKKFNNNNNLKIKVNEEDCGRLNTILSDNPNKTLNTLGEGTFGISFKGCLTKKCDKKQAIKLVSRKRHYNNTPTHPGTIEISMNYKLSELVKKKYTPHINLLYDNIKCAFKELKTLKTLQYTEWLEKTKDMYNNNSNNSNNKNKLYIDSNVLFMEKGSYDLATYLYNNGSSICYEELLEILFIVVYTLSVIQHNVKGFRHNDLKPNNLVVKEVKKTNTYIKYNILGKEFFIKNRGYIVKIIDFDMSWASEKKFKNQKIESFHSTNYKTIGYGPFINSVFDIHFFMSTLYKLLNPFKFNKDIAQFCNLIYNINKPKNGLIPEDCFELKSSSEPLQSKHVNNNKLTNYHIDSDTNYVPPDMLSPCEMILDSSLFKELQHTSKSTLSTKKSTKGSRNTSNNSQNLRRNVNLSNNMRNIEELFATKTVSNTNSKKCQRSKKKNIKISAVYTSPLKLINNSIFNRADMFNIKLNSKK